jgi:predicted phosphodiesterase
MGRLAVLSDVHANLQALEAVTAAATEARVDGFIVCGDIVGYGADPEPVLDRLHGLPLRSIVGGNHDLAAVGRFPVAWFNEVAAAALRWTADRLSADARSTLHGLEAKERAVAGLVVHGSVVEPVTEYLMPGADTGAARSFDAEEFDRCFFGHTHVPTLFERGPDGEVRGRHMAGEPTATLDPVRRYLLNPGSVGQPRDGDPRAAFMVVDEDDGLVAWHRVPYDVEGAQSRIRSEGLPRVLAERLAVGR